MSIPSSAEDQCDRVQYKPYLCFCEYLVLGSLSVCSGFVGLGFLFTTVFLVTLPSSFLMLVTNTALLEFCLIISRCSFVESSTWGPFSVFRDFVLAV